jgi:quinohemoprotein amine dehydrogenase
MELMAGRVLGALFFTALCCLPATAQEAGSTPEVKVTTPTASPDEAGFPVKDALTLSKCGGCHAPDAKGNMTRISFIRTTPEGWEEAIKRMIRLNGLELSPDEARSIVRYLSDHHGLAPEENEKIAYFTEHRIVDEKIPSPEVGHACAACHALAKPLSWHRTPADWQYLENMHIAFFPAVRFTAFDHPREGVDPAAGPPKGPTPAEQALEYIAKSSPLHSTVWAEWQASMQAPKLAGRWLIAGSEPGKGRFFGEMTIEPSAAGDSFTTKTKLTCVCGSPMAASGKALVYAGYAWRGRSTVEAAAASSPEAPQAMREVMALSKDQNEFKGRWFWGAYQEFGMDVTMRRG